ncbi:MAG TPA: hypothetical protein PLU52_05060 [Opitutaceae bacterium]|nr:hypothetical protein [Opitutaceae bacterium]
MTQFSDDLYLGAADGPQAFSASAYGRGVGPLGRVYVWDIVPLTLDADGICASQSVSTANATINGALASGGSVTLDVPRALQMAAAVGNTSNVTVTGTDYYGRAQTETRALNGTTPVNFLKAFKTVTQVFVNGAVTTFTIGTRDAFGFPYRVTNVAYLATVKWNSTLAQDAGTFTAADTTSPATASTGDVRGLYQPSNAADGSKRLVAAILLPAIAAGPDATTVGAIGVTPA